MLPARDFLAGLKIPAGTVLRSREMIPLSQKTPWPRKPLPEKTAAAN